MSMAKKMWARHFLVCEFVLSVAIGAFIVVWSERFDGRFTIDKVLDGNRGTLYGTLTSVLGALLGFAITSISIILTVANSPGLKPLQESPHNDTLWNTFMASIRCLGVGTIAGLAALFVDRDNTPNHAMFYLMSWILCLAVFRTWRCIWILDNVVRVVARSGDR